MLAIFAMCAMFLCEATLASMWAHMKGDNQMGFSRSFKRNMKQPAYMNKIIALADAMKLERGVYMTSVYHENRCSIWLNGECDCNPEIQIEQVKKR